jgi:tripartite-type tricarboxylate transporter receptor subunit TctC
LLQGLSTLRQAPQRQRWKQPVIVTNRPGAGTIIGLQATASAAPDGYTIGMDSISHIVQPAVRAKLPYDPVNDFTFITKLLEAPYVLTVNSSMPIQSMADLTKYMKDNPDKLNYGSFGIGSSGHIFMEILNQHTGTLAKHIPYKGTAEATMAQLNGDAPVMFDMIVSPLPHIRKGTLRPLMVTTEKRSSMLPDVPTSKELGINDLVMPTWFGLVGPKGIPPHIVKELNAAVTNALRQPQIIATLEKQGLTPTPSTPEEMRQFVVTSINTMVRAATAAKIPKVDN